MIDIKRPNFDSSYSSSYAHYYITQLAKEIHSKRYSTLDSFWIVYIAMRDQGIAGCDTAKSFYWTIHSEVRKMCHYDGVTHASIGRCIRAKHPSLRISDREAEEAMFNIIYTSLMERLEDCM